MKSRIYHILLLAILIGNLFACNPNNIFQQQKFFANQEWKSSDTVLARIQIEDTTKPYHIYIVVRHTNAYNYNNMWVKIKTTPPGKPTQEQLLELRLANNTNGWLGSGMDDIFEHKIRITAQPVFLQKGTHQFVLQQEMRQDPLLEVLNAGIRIEKQMQ